MATTLAVAYDPNISKVQCSVTGVVGTANYVVVQRLVNGPWRPAGGGAPLPLASNATAVADYEFLPNVVNTYRARAHQTNGTLLETSSSVTVTPSQDRVWVKSIGRPFLNRAVTLNDPGEAERRSRSTAFDIVGRRTPIAVNDVHSSRVRTITLVAEDQEEADLIDLLTSVGDTLFVQVPPDGPMPSVYAIVGDTKITPTSRRAGTRATGRRFVELPLTEVAAPDATVAPQAATWQTVLNVYASWSALSAAHSTWQSVGQLIGSPTDVVVG